RAANVADGDAHPRIVASPLDLPRIGFGIDVEDAVVEDEPHWRFHAFAVLLERLDRDVFLAVERGEVWISHVPNLAHLEARRPRQHDKFCLAVCCTIVSR